LCRGEFDQGKKSLSVAVNGPLIVDDVETLIRAAIDGVGLALCQMNGRHRNSKAGTRRVLDDWCQAFPGFFLYYPSRHQEPAAPYCSDRYF
jgi:DNA-binding transcriptional LysR family regulator